MTSTYFKRNERVLCLLTLQILYVFCVCVGAYVMCEEDETA